VRLLGKVFHIGQATDWLANAGEMPASIRSFPWQRTLLGPLPRWSPEVRASVNMMLTFPQPSVLLLGGDHILLYNDAYNNTSTGDHPGMKVGFPVQDIVPNFWRRYRSVVEQVEQLKKAVLLNAQSFCNDKWFSISFTPLGAEPSDLIGTLILMNETRSDKQKWVEADFFITNNLLRSQYENSPDLIMLIDRNYTIKSLNKTIYSHQTVDSFLGKNAIAILPTIAHEIARSKIEECISTGEIQYFEHEVMNNQQASARIVPIRNFDGYIENVMVISTNITERKRAEERLLRSEEKFSKAFMQSPIPMVLATLNEGRYMEVNHAFCEKLGIDRKEAIGHTAIELGFWVDPSLRQPYFDQLRRDRFLRNIELQFKMRRGDLRTFLVSGEVLLLDKAECILIQAIDVTERRKLENELRTAIAVRDEFMSVASHELKTPFTALHMQLQLLDRLASLVEGVSDLRIKRMIKAALASAQSLNCLLDELLDFTKVRAGRLTLRKEQLDLRALVFEHISITQEEAETKGSSLILNADQAIIGNWDRKRINQIVSNLLSNAIKYGEGKPIEVTLSVDSKREICRLSVKDYGIGIAEDMQGIIFERFQRVAKNGSIAGLGLGLYISRQLVEAHGGSIYVESELGKGSLFIVELPISSSTGERDGYCFT
jgi:PAS domain S-box-containing protein